MIRADTSFAGGLPIGGIALSASGSNGDMTAADAFYLSLATAIAAVPVPTAGLLLRARVAVGANLIRILTLRTDA